MKEKKKFLSKIISVLLVAVLMVGMVPKVVMLSVNAAPAEENYRLVSVDGTMVYMYGADTIEQPKESEDGNWYEIEYTGGSELALGICVDGTDTMVSEDEVKYENQKISISKVWLSNNSSAWIAVKCSVDAIIPTDDPAGVPDTTAPVITGAVKSIDTWTNGDVIVILQTTDADVTAYKMDNNEWQNGNEFTLSANGTYEFYIKDNVGNISSAAYQVDITTIDKVAPLLTSVTDPSTNDGGRTADVEVSGSDETNGSGIDTAEGYGISKKNDKSDITWQSSNRINISENGIYYFYLKDKAGNISDASAAVQVDMVDGNAPVISSITFEPDNWTNGEVTATVNASDGENGTGIPSVGGYGISERSDKTNITWQDTNVFTISADAGHITHYFYVKDNVGNISEATDGTAAKFDNIAPVITDVVIKYGETEVANGSYTNPDKQYTFTVIATDEKSGIAGYSTDGITWKQSGEFLLSGGSNYDFYVKDNAGNISTRSNVILETDSTKPTITSAEPSTTELTNQTVVYTVTAADGESGIPTSGGYGISDTNDGSNIAWQDSNLFSITDSDRHYIYVRDNAVPANVECIEIQAVNYSDQKPVIKSISVNPLNEWTNEPVTFTVQADSVINSAGTEVPIVGYKMDEDDDEWLSTNTFIVTNSDEHSFYVKDDADNVSEVVKKSASKYDAKLPQLESGNNGVIFSQENSGVVATVLNWLTFGNFFNEKLIVTVNASDVEGEGNEKSGIKEYTLIFINENGEEKEIKQTTNVFSISKKEIENFKGTMKVIVTDNAGNTMETDITTANSNLGSFDEIMIENDAPVISEVTSTQSGVCNQNFEVGFAVDDVTDKKYAGIAGVKVSVNGTTVMQEEYSNAVVSQKSYTCEVDIANKTVNGYKIANWNNAKLEMKIEACDNAGNAATPNVKTYYIDQTAPVISGFNFDLTSNIDVNSEDGKYNSLKDAVEFTPYGFYFKETVEVTVSAEDKPYTAETKESGVKSIVVYLQDNEEEGQLYTVLQNGGTIEKISTIGEAKEILTSGDVSFRVPADFKGQIYAYAIDNLGNMPTNCVYKMDDKMDENGFVHPNGMAIESREKHSKTSAIKFIVPETSMSENSSYAFEYLGAGIKDTEMDYNAAKQVPLYNGNPTFGVKVTDAFSGIRKVSWTVFEGGQQSTKSIEIDNNGVMTGDVEGWNISKNTNLVESVENKNIVVDGNYNDMVLLVELTDRAGHISYDYYAFGIDKTAPSIDVSYDNNNSDTVSGDGTTYFKSGRTATVTVTERNFNADKVMISSTKDGVSYPVSGEWSTSAQSGNGDDMKHTIHINYGEDGDYTFNVSYSDRAANQNTAVNYQDSVAPTVFTVDKTAPTISVSYDNNSALNAKYFKENRTATIIVQEHNFDENRIQVTQTASKDGAAIGTPRVVWSHSGDVHTGTIQYNVDGDYTFDISMDDKAGNQSGDANYGNSAAAQEFTIDTEIEKPVITGVENGKSYKDDVEISISYEDVNFDSDDVKLLRTQKGEKDVDVTEEFIKNLSSNGNGKSGTNNTFDKKMENDGIYTLTVKVNDKAGNEESESLTFTINRFGSVYAFDEYLVSLQDSYVQKVEENLVITEYNPDKLLTDSTKVAITRDGTPLESVEYTVNPVANDQVAIGESGWYQYEYTIDAANFAKDGIYKLTILSEDVAGNKPETTNYEDCDMLFRVDTTPAEITSVTGLENSIVNAENQKVDFEVFDAIGLKKVDVYVNNKVVESYNKFEDLIHFNGSITLKEGTEQKVRFVIEDLAGNITDSDSEEFVPGFAFNKEVTVSTNWFIRWYANKALFIGTIGGATVAVGGATTMVMFRKRKLRAKVK